MTPAKPLPMVTPCTSTLWPTNPMLIPSSSVLPGFPLGNCAGAGCNWPAHHLVLLNLDLHVDAGGKVELHQRVHRLVGRVDDIHQPQMRADLELIARGL